MKPQDHETYTRQTFDSFCKKVLKYAARDYHRALARRAERETPFSELSAHELASLAATDEYFKDEYVFSVLGESVGVSDGELAEALNGLPQDRRDIVLLSYFFDMTDKEIAERLKLARRTVAYRRTSSLRLLKNLLESEE
jgi:RNA polymerase sigma factor (sigma-70 family)